MDDDLLAGSRAGDTDSDDDEDDDDDDDNTTQMTSPKGSEESAEKPAKDGQAPNGILDLRARLQAKIQGLQSKRKTPLSGNDAVDEGRDDESVASTKDELLEERRKKRGEMRDKRRQAMKERRKVEREGGQDKKGNVAGNGKKGVASSSGAGGNGSKAPTLLVNERASSSNGAHGDRQQGSLGSGEVTFSTLQFGEDSEVKGKKNRHVLPSDPKAALAVLEARKRKDEARAAKRGGGRAEEEESKAIDQERKERERWSKAEAAAQGIKIRDDEGLLKKAAKKRDKIKDKSRKEWADRDKDQKDQLAARIKKRTDNIAARKDRSKKGGKGIGGKKMGGGGKKTTKARAGFEGRGRNTKGSAKPQKSSHK